MFTDIALLVIGAGTVYAIYKNRTKVETKAKAELKAIATKADAAAKSAETKLESTFHDVEAICSNCYNKVVRYVVKEAKVICANCEKHI